MVQKKRKAGQGIFIIAGLTTLTVFTWIGLDAYRSFKKSAVPKVLTEQLRALSPDFDTRTIEALETRMSISEKELDSLPPRRLKLVEEEIIQTEVASPTGELALPETATPGGELE